MNQTKSQSARVNRLKNGKTVRTPYGFARFVICGKYEYTPYRSIPRTYRDSAEEILVVMLTDESERLAVKA